LTCDRHTKVVHYKKGRVIYYDKRGRLGELRQVFNGRVWFSSLQSRNYESDTFL